MKVMISLPMNGIPDEKIKERIKLLKDKFSKLHIDVVNSFIESYDKEIESNNIGVYYLGKILLDYMHNVDAVYFDDGWINNRGCRIENAICQEYGIKILDGSFLNIPSVKIMNQPQIKGPTPEMMYRQMDPVTGMMPRQIEPVTEITPDMLNQSVSEFNSLGQRGECDART